MMWWSWWFELWLEPLISLGKAQTMNGEGLFIPFMPPHDSSVPVAGSLQSSASTWMLLQGCETFISWFLSQRPAICPYVCLFCHIGQGRGRTFTHNVLDHKLSSASRCSSKVVSLGVAGTERSVKSDNQKGKTQSHKKKQIIDDGLHCNLFALDSDHGARRRYMFGPK